MRPIMLLLAPYNGAHMTAGADARGGVSTRDSAALATAIYACHELADVFADSSVHIARKQQLPEHPVGIPIHHQ
jgi:hypothetical protein